MIYRIGLLSRSVQYAKCSKPCSCNDKRSISNGNTKNWPSCSRSSNLHRTCSFQVLVLQRTIKKFKKVYNARAKPYFAHWSFLFGDVLFSIGKIVLVKNSVRRLGNLACNRWPVRLDAKQTLNKRARYYYH